MKKLGLALSVGLMSTVALSGCGSSSQPNYMGVCMHNNIRVLDYHCNSYHYGYSSYWIPGRYAVPAVGARASHGVNKLPAGANGFKNAPTKGGKVNLSKLTPAVKATNKAKTGVISKVKSHFGGSGGGRHH